MENKNTSVAVLGLGKMGSAISKTLLKKKFQVTTWNRTIEKCFALQQDGTITARTINEAIKNSDIIIISLLDYPTVDSLLRPLTDLMHDKMIINLTNGSPIQADETAGYVTLAGGLYLDGGIMAIPAMLGQPNALLLLSGSEQAFNQTKDLLETLGTCQYIGKDPGRAALYDLALLAAMYGMYSGYLQSIALIKSAHVKAGDFTPMVIQWLQAMSQSLSRLGEAIDANAHTEGVAANLEMQTNSFENLISTYNSVGIPVDLVQPLKQHMETAVANGYGNANFSAVFEVIKGKEKVSQ